jgi:biopolymer transport protein ExbB
MPGNDLNLLARGGPMMWVLGALALVLFMVFVERVLFLHRSQIRPEAFLEGIRNILARRRLVEALTVCEQTPGPVAAVVKAALLHADASEERMRLQVQEAALNEIPVLERRIGALAVIAQVAPLVGILGTVLGMITTFAAFEQGGNYAMAAALSRGMWQALVASAGGLLLAIPAHLAHHFLAARVRSIVRDVEWSGNEIMKYLITEYRVASKDAAAGS